MTTRGAGADARLPRQNRNLRPGFGPLHGLDDLTLGERALPYGSGLLKGRPRPLGIRISPGLVL